MGVSRSHLVGPISLLVVQVSEVRFKASSMRGVFVVVATQVPLSDHVADVAKLVQVLREKLWRRSETSAKRNRNVNEKEKKRKKKKKKDKKQARGNEPNAFVKRTGVTTPESRKRNDLTTRTRTE